MSKGSKIPKLTQLTQDNTSSSDLMGQLLVKTGQFRGGVVVGQKVEGKVVEGFPALPLFPKSEVIESYGKDGKYGAAFISSGDLVKVVNFYNDSLPRSGWQVSLKQQSETNYFFEIKNDQLEGAIIINTAADGKKTAITISTAPR